MKLWPFRGNKDTQRALAVEDLTRLDRAIDLLVSSERRRAARTDQDVVAVYGAVYAAIRRRSVAITKPRLALVRRRGDKLVEEPDDHPIIQPLHEVNESLTMRQGFGLIEQHKLTTGKAYWIKRRNGLGKVVEFEIWPPLEVEIKAERERPWVPDVFQRRRTNWSVEQVAFRDVLWFRHLVDPRNPLNGLGPIGAIRAEVDTALEAQRFNQRYFDNATRLGQVWAAPDAGPAEVDRMEQDLERKFRGTDNAFRGVVLAGELKPMETKVPHKDMEFVAQMQWGVEEVARVFEMAPSLLGQARLERIENTRDADIMFWQVMQDQYESMVEEFNEFYVWPDYGREFLLVGRYDHISALQEDAKLRAEIDEIYLRTAKVFVNELRERDGQEAVTWGNVPLLPMNVAPLGSVKPKAVEPPRSRSRDADDVGAIEGVMRSGWEDRLAREMEAVIRHLKAAALRDLEPSDVGSHDWDWLKKYGVEVQIELEAALAEALASQGFVETPLLSAQQVAKNFARRRAGELLRLEGRESVVAYTRERVGELVAETLEEGWSLNTLEKKLREEFAFSKSRAEMIARTESRRANTEGSLTSYQSLGHEGKEWLTARDERVDGGDPSGPCISAQGQGAIRVQDPFNNGRMGPPAHPRCRCTLVPVHSMPRSNANINGNRKKIARKVVRDDEGRIATIIEEEIA